MVAGTFTRFLTGELRMSEGRRKNQLSAQDWVGDTRGGEVKE